MDEIFLQHKNGKGLHHFYICIGDKLQTAGKIHDFCKQDLCPEGNLDWIYEDFDAIKVDDARKISGRSVLKTRTGSKMIFCLACNDINSAAQNALLKVVEEPTTDTFFFLVCPRKSIFLPTILSRAIVVDGVVTEGESLLQDLLAKSLAGRIKWADDLAAAVKADKKEKGEVHEIVLNLIKELEAGDLSIKETSVALKTLSKVSDYLNDQSASIKMLLESAVMALPQK
jgi:hypothetical protein